MLVRILNGGTNLKEKFDAARNGKFVGVAIFIDRAPGDELHDEVGSAVFGAAAVEKASDVGMVESGENLALIAEVVQDETRSGRGANEFDGDFLIELAVGTYSGKDFAHAARSNFIKDRVVADLEALAAVCGGRLQVCSVTNIARELIVAENTE